MKYLEDMGLACMEPDTDCQEPTLMPGSGQVYDAGGEYVWPLLDFVVTVD